MGFVPSENIVHYEEEITQISFVFELIKQSDSGRPIEMSPSVNYALSIKQPWATLILSGLKSIEIRRWRTSIRGPIFIHAAKIPDKRPQGWKILPERLHEAAKLGGELIGIAILTDCHAYENYADFIEDQARHHNSPDWFQHPRMYGFAFRDPIAIRPIRLSGNVRFFNVDLTQVWD